MRGFNEGAFKLLDSGKSNDFKYVVYSKAHIWPLDVNDKFYPIYEVHKYIKIMKHRGKLLAKYSGRMILRVD